MAGTEPLPSNNGGYMYAQEGRLTGELLEVVFLMGSAPSYMKKATEDHGQ